MLALMIAYSSILVLSGIALSKWLHKNRAEELGNSWLAAAMFGSFLAIVWPVSIPMMLISSK